MPLTLSATTGILRALFTTLETDFGWTIFLAAAMSVTIAFDAQPASAQTSPLPQATLQRPAIQQIPAYCQHSTLTGLEFRGSIHAIIAHGDLTDVAFIEKTLGTEFSLNYGWKPDGSQDTQKLIYQSNHMLGDTIQVSLHINTASPPKGGQIAFISFNGNPMTALYPTFISDCLHMSSNDFSSSFGTEFFRDIPVGDVPVRGEPYSPPPISVGKYLNYPGKDSTHLKLGIGYNAKDLIVSQVGIGQYR